VADQLWFMTRIREVVVVVRVIVIIIINSSEHRSLTSMFASTLHSICFKFAELYDFLLCNFDR